MLRFLLFPFFSPLLPLFLFPILSLSFGPSFPPLATRFPSSWAAVRLSPRSKSLPQTRSFEPLPREVQERSGPWLSSLGINRVVAIANELPPASFRLNRLNRRDSLQSRFPQTSSTHPPSLRRNTIRPSARRPDRSHSPHRVGFASELHRLWFLGNRRDSSTSESDHSPPPPLHAQPCFACCFARCFVMAILERRPRPVGHAPTTFMNLSKKQWSLVLVRPSSRLPSQDSILFLLTRL